MKKVKQLGNIYNDSVGLGYAGNVWDKEELCPTLTTMQGGGREPMIIVSMRGRNPDNPSDSTPGITTEQRLEPNSEGLCNTLTTVQKDNLVLENIVIGGMQEHQSIKDDGVCTTLTSSMGSGGGYVPMVVEDKKTIIYDDYNSNIPKNQNCIGTLTTNIGSSAMRTGLKIIEKNEFYEQAIKTAEENNAQEGDIVDAFNQRVLTDGISPTVTTRPEGKKIAILPVVEKYRIRKLTPRECFRLMNVEEEQFNRAEKVVSNSQLYKIAGNAIVVSVLVAIFSQMNIQGKKNWNSLSKEEREKLVYKNSILENKKCE